MPELPEVETIRSQLAPRLEGRTLMRVEILDPRLTRPIDLFEVAEELEGDSARSVERRGKYLVLRLESGLALLVHLRMTGSFGFEPTTHERAVLELDDGTRLAYRDVRRFGTWLVVDGRSSSRTSPPRTGRSRSARGSPPSGSARACRRRAALKAVLLDQRVVAGLGNIYADEALWRARLSPLLPAQRPRPGRDPTLAARYPRSASAGHRAPGIDALRLSKPDGSPGGMQDEFRVYGRDGHPCPRCRTPITKTRVGGRGHVVLPALSGLAGHRRDGLAGRHRKLVVRRLRLGRRGSRRPARRASAGAPRLRSLRTCLGGQ